MRRALATLTVAAGLAVLGACDSPGVSPLEPNAITPDKGGITPLKFYLGHVNPTGSWKFTHDVDKRHYWLRISEPGRSITSIACAERTDGWPCGGLSGIFGSSMGPSTFVYLYRMLQVVEGQETSVIVAAWGDGETFRAAVFPDTPSNRADIVLRARELSPADWLPFVRDLVAIGPDVITGTTAAFRDN